MLEYIFVDLPMAVIGYAAAVFVVSRFVEVHDAGATVLSPQVTPSGTVPEAIPKVKESEEPVLESTTETWSVDHEPEGLTTLDDDDIAIFDPMTMVEFDSQDEEPGSHVPSDVVLRRHYLTHLRMMLETVRQDKWYKAQENLNKFIDLFQETIYFDNTESFEITEEYITKTYQALNH